MKAIDQPPRQIKIHKKINADIEKDFLLGTNPSVFDDMIDEFFPQGQHQSSFQGKSSLAIVPPSTKSRGIKHHRNSASLNNNQNPQRQAIDQINQANQELGSPSRSQPNLTPQNYTGSKKDQIIMAQDSVNYQISQVNQASKYHDLLRQEVTNQNGQVFSSSENKRRVRQISGRFRGQNHNASAGRKEKLNAQDRAQAIKLALNVNRLLFMGKNQKQVPENYEKPIQYMKIKKNQNVMTPQFEPYMQSTATLVNMHGGDPSRTMKSPYNAKPFANTKNLNSNNRRYNRQQIQNQAQTRDQYNGTDGTAVYHLNVNNRSVIQEQLANPYPGTLQDPDKIAANIQNFQQKAYGSKSGSIGVSSKANPAVNKLRNNYGQSQNNIGKRGNYKLNEPSRPQLVPGKGIMFLQNDDSQRSLNDQNDSQDILDKRMSVDFDKEESRNIKQMMIPSQIFTKTIEDQPQGGDHSNFENEQNLGFYNQNGEHSNQDHQGSMKQMTSLQVLQEENPQKARKNRAKSSHWRTQQNENYHQFAKINQNDKQISHMNKMIQGHRFNNKTNIQSKVSSGRILKEDNTRNQAQQAVTGMLKQHRNMINTIARSQNRPSRTQSRNEQQVEQTQTTELVRMPLRGPSVEPKSDQRLLQGSQYNQNFVRDGLKDSIFIKLNQNNNNQRKNLPRGKSANPRNRANGFQGQQNMLAVSAPKNTRNITQSNTKLLNETPNTDIEKEQQKKRQNYPRKMVLSPSKVYAQIPDKSLQSIPRPKSPLKPIASSAAAPTQNHRKLVPNKDKLSNFFNLIRKHKDRQNMIHIKFEEAFSKAKNDEEQQKLHATYQREKHQLFTYGDFQIGLKIGQGAFAIVRRCVHKSTGHVVALKTYEKKNLTDPLASKALHKEIFILAHMDHQNIMSLYEVIDTRTHVHLVMELCQGKNLYHLVKKEKNGASPGLPESEAGPIFAQIVSAVAYMHSRGVAHRDLKLDNILINQNNQIKIIDFGFATRCKAGDHHNTHCGTAHYMDPDLARRKNYQPQAADVWALGVILFILLTGKLPFYAEFEADLFRKIQTAKYSYPLDYRQCAASVQVTVSSQAKAVIKKIFEVSANLRLTGEQLQKEPFVKSYSPKQRESAPTSPTADRSPRHQRVVLIKEEYQTLDSPKQPSIGNSPKFIEGPSKVDDVKITIDKVDQVEKSRDMEQYEQNTIQEDDVAEALETPINTIQRAIDKEQPSAGQLQLQTDDTITPKLNILPKKETENQGPQIIFKPQNSGFQS